MSGRGVMGVPLLALLNSAAEVVVLPQLGRQKAQEAVALLDRQGPASVHHGSHFGVV